MYCMHIIIYIIILSINLYISFVCIILLSHYPPCRLFCCHKSNDIKIKHILPSALMINAIVYNAAARTHTITLHINVDNNANNNSNSSSNISIYEIHLFCMLKWFCFMHISLFLLPYSIIYYHSCSIIFMFYYYYEIREWIKRTKCHFGMTQFTDKISNAWAAWMHRAVMLWRRIICWLLRHSHCLQCASASPSKWQFFRAQHTDVLSLVLSISLNYFLENFHPLSSPIIIYLLLQNMQIFLCCLFLPRC